jgi:formiminotetrahydrofolate cyclodeaminase
MFEEKNLKEFIDALSSKEVVPGGGSLGFLLISLGCAVILKTVRVSQKNFSSEPIYQKYVNAIENISNEFLADVEKDASDYLEATKLIKVDKTAFIEKLVQSTKYFVEKIKNAISFLNYTSEFSAFIKDSVYSDLDCGKYCIIAGMQCLVRTAFANIKSIKGEEKNHLLNELNSLKINIDRLKYTL